MMAVKQIDMNEKKETVWASLQEICDETRLVRDPETGRMMKKPASFVSMKALLRGDGI